MAKMYCIFVCVAYALYVMQCMAMMLKKTYIRCTINVLVTKIFTLKKKKKAWA